jgi:DNA-directed RNA polymerase subunit RPC12/RpoP
MTGAMEATKMSHASRTIQCECGFTMTTDRDHAWCSHCGGRIFLKPEDKRKYRFFTASMWLILASVFGLVVYFFVEIIMKPMA